ncbi:MAG: NAD(P)H-hydrate dehydratase [Deltaproteobacteria bacterium]|jgi:NAD(P)H-hydrate epimerase|nr:NAD(P)H-hydrate dehydratase [Deltaproteobacteria bacterium]
MRHFPTYITTNSESKKIDTVAITQFGIPGIVLMENAAHSILRHALRFFPWLKKGGQTIFILAGPGQNGGDGWVLARLFFNLGHSVTCYLVGNPDKEPQGDAEINYQVIKKIGIPIYSISQPSDLLPPWEKAHLVVDALFGTGLSHELSGAPLRVLQSATQSPRTFKVLAVDLPSGLSGDTGIPLGPVLPADLTVSLGTLKLGLFLNEGPDLAGALRLGDIGLVDPMFQNIPKGTLINAAYAQKLLLPRPKASHKKTFGHAVLIGASPGKTGALVLAALGALRSGAGLITAAHPEELSGILEEKLTAPMTLGLPADADGSLNSQAAQIALKFLADKDALGLGPGLAVSPTSQTFCENIVQNSAKPLIIDASALTNLVNSVELLQQRIAPTILTPHPGEAARLLGVSNQKIQEDRLTFAKKLANLTNSIVVLKGANTIIVNPATGKFLINSSGSPILATGGTGDLLTGLITGLVAQKMEPFFACALGVFIHGLAGELAAKQQAAFGLSPLEICNFIPLAFRKLMMTSPHF